MKIITASPEMEDVPGSDNVRVLITKVPCGICYSTEFFAVDGTLLRQDQHVIVDKMSAMDGAAQL